MSREILKPITGFHYSVSTYGRVRNDKTNKFLKGRTQRKGYLKVGLYQNGICNDFQIHRLVLITHSPVKGYEYLDVNHIDAVVTNNNIDNLEWCTRKENCEHAVKLGLYPRGEKHHLSKLSNRDADLIRVLYKSGTTQATIASLYEVDQSVISRCVTRKRGGKYR